MADEMLTTEVGTAVSKAARSILGEIKTNAANEKIYRATLMTAVLYARAIGADIIKDIATTQLAVQASVERANSVKNSLLTLKNSVEGVLKDQDGLISQYDFDILPRK